MRIILAGSSAWSSSSLKLAAMMSRVREKMPIKGTPVGAAGGRSAAPRSLASSASIRVTRREPAPVGASGSLTSPRSRWQRRLPHGGDGARRAARRRSSRAWRRCRSWPPCRACCGRTCGRRCSCSSHVGSGRRLSTRHPIGCVGRAPPRLAVRRKPPRAGLRLQLTSARQVPAVACFSFAGGDRECDTVVLPPVRVRRRTPRRQDRQPRGQQRASPERRDREEG